eukprot:15448020-Alexandrium_andersonii.AAC.1
MVLQALDAVLARLKLPLTVSRATGQRSAVIVCVLRFRASHECGPTCPGCRTPHKRRPKDVSGTLKP